MKNTSKSSVTLTLLLFDSIAGVSWANTVCSISEDTLRGCCNSSFVQQYLPAHRWNSLADFHTQKPTQSSGMQVCFQPAAYSQPQQSDVPNMSLRPALSGFPCLAFPFLGFHLALLSKTLALQHAGLDGALESCLLPLFLFPGHACQHIHKSDITSVPAWHTLIPSTVRRKRAFSEKYFKV